LTGEAYTCGCLASAACRAVVPAFGAPMMSTSGRDSLVDMWEMLAAALPDV
jgi:hypothetical protein